MKFKLTDKKDEASGTKSFFFEPEEKIDWLPGQYFYITLPKLTHEDPRGNTRHVTNSASPTEGNLVRITTRVRKESGFKQSLDELPIGSEIEGKGPNGIFTIDEKAIGSHIFLAGGIGITPFRSIIKYALDKNLGLNMNLVYSNSLPEEIAFRKELENWTSNQNFKLYMTISKPEESKEKWDGLTGRIDENLINKLFAKQDLQKSIFWVSGPPTFVDAMEEMLGKMRIPVDNIRTEKFTGY